MGRRLAPLRRFRLGRLAVTGFLHALQPMLQPVRLLRNRSDCRRRDHALRTNHTGHAAVSVLSGMNLFAARRAEAGVIVDLAPGAADLRRRRDLDAGPSRTLRLAGLLLRLAGEGIGTVDIRVALDQFEQFAVERDHVVFRQRRATQRATDLLGLVDLEILRTDGLEFMVGDLKSRQRAFPITPAGAGQLV
jgi:hypothetical protein